MEHNLVCKVVGTATIKVNMFDNVVRTLKDVRHVLDLKKNLISLGTIDSDGFRYKSENGIMKVLKDAMIMMKERKINDNIYKLLGSTIVGGAIVVIESQQDDILLWHMQSRHIGEHGIRELQK